MLLGFIYDPGLWFPHDFVIDGKKCHLSQYWIDSGKDPDPHLQIYKLVRMLDYVYPGRFKYRKDSDMYILEDLC